MKGVATGVVLTILAGGGIRAVQFYRSGEILSDVSFTQKVKYLENMIDEEYLGDISTDDLKEGVYAGLIYGLDDVYSRYYTKEQYDQENATTEGSYVGIGVSMQQNAAGGVQIVECYKGSTAEEAGIKAGDVITAIDGEDITDAELSDVVSMIKKKQDEDVVLTVQRQGEDTQEITVKVSDVELPSVFGEMLDENTGYIQITEFKGVTAQQYEETFADLKDQGMTRLIVDLRDNPGGAVLPKESPCSIADPKRFSSVSPNRPHPGGKGHGQSSQSERQCLPDAPAVSSFSYNDPVPTAAFCPGTYTLRTRSCLGQQTA